MAKAEVEAKSLLRPESVRRFGRDRQVAELLDCSRASVWRMARKGILPKPRKISTGITVWDLAEVLAAVERER